VTIGVHTVVSPPADRSSTQQAVVSQWPPRSAVS